MTAPDRQKLTDEEFEEVVEEIAKEQAASGTGVTEEQAREALKELDLPPEKLEAAAEKVRERHAAEARAQAEEKAKKKKRLVIGAGALAVAVACAIGVGVAVQAKATHTAAVAAITATDPVIIAEPNQLRMSAKLMSAPHGEAVPMTCSWRSPDGALLHENAWNTKPVSHDAWETHCVLPKTPEHVKVVMTAHGRVVAETSR